MLHPATAGPGGPRRKDPRGTADVAMVALLLTVSASSLTDMTVRASSVPAVPPCCVWWNGQVHGCRSYPNVHY